MPLPKMLRGTLRARAGEPPVARGHRAGARGAARLRRAGPCRRRAVCWRPAPRRQSPQLVPPWTQSLGAPVLASPYGVPSKFEANVQRRESPGLTRTPHSSVSFTPLQSLFGIITPSGLHFERHHAGVPDIDPHQHRLMIHGLVPQSARLHDGRPDALPVGVAHPLHRMRREHRHGVGQRRGADGAVHARHARLQRVDRRAAVDAARRGRLRPRRRSSCSPKAPTARR